MTRSKLKIAISGLIASAIMLALFLVPGIKSPASAETWEPAFGGSGSGTFARPDTVTVGWEDNVSFHSEDPVSALKVTLGDVVIDGTTYSILQNSSNACIDFKFEYYIGDQVHTTTLNYEDGGADDGFYFQCSVRVLFESSEALTIMPPIETANIRIEHIITILNDLTVICLFLLRLSLLFLAAALLYVYSELFIRKTSNQTSVLLL